MRKPALISITIVIAILGLFMAYYSYKQYLSAKSACAFQKRIYQNGEVIPEYKPDYNCRCVQGKITCDSLEISGRDDLFYGAIPDDAFSAVIQRVDNIREIEEVKFLSTDSDKVYVNVKIATNCPEENQSVNLKGYYRLTDKKIYLFTDPGLEVDRTDPKCLATMKYSLTLKLFDRDKLRGMEYVNPDMSSVVPSFCIYNSEMHTGGEMFKSIDGCSVCSCKVNQVECQPVANCNPQTSSDTKSVYWNHPNYSEYEYPEKDNECTGNSQCFAMGCTGEICTADKSIKPSCSSIAKIPDLKCSCISHKCIWTDK